MSACLSSLQINLFIASDNPPFCCFASADCPLQSPRKVQQLFHAKCEIVVNKTKGPAKLNIPSKLWLKSNNNDNIFRVDFNLQKKHYINKGRDN